MTENTETETGRNAEADAAAEERELVAAGRMTTTAAEDHADADGFTGSAAGQPPAPGTVGIGLVGWLRWFWRQLTSMRVALILLFLLSLAAVPGSLVPQQSENALKVSEFRTAHTELSPLYDKLGLFHVYSSPWFSAIYILLFVSLAGCIIPRCWQFAKVLRAKPPAAPRHLVRMPVYARWRTSARPEEVLDGAEKVLRKRRFRVGRAPSAFSLGSEKGYLREVGNLLFHVSLFGLLIAFAVGKLYGGQGSALVIQGHGFTNTLTQYDDFSPSTFYGADNLDDFGFTLNSFKATYQTSGDQLGTARTFDAYVDYWNGDPGKTKRATIQVNHPLKIGGSNVYLVNHGYAPVVTVRDAKGNVAYTGPSPCLQQDQNWTSTCAIKVADYTSKDGRSTQLGFGGIFAPTMVVDSVRGPHSVFPALDNPALYLTGYVGDLGIDSGLPQNVYQLDTTHMKQMTASQGAPAKAALTPGQTWTLPNGAGTLTFNGVQQWAQFNVAHNPGSSSALISAVLAIIGLIGSLFVQRRRIWVRAVEGPDGTTLVEVAGLGRSESARIAEELADVAVDLQQSAPADVAEASEDSEDAGDPEPSEDSADDVPGPRAETTSPAAAAATSDLPPKE
ncbi:cytochrome c biogenesis protein ResB [Phaeacidiphilus oryzae]|uniref:cytochrome c biogenesis protein ResB n=1 Tax=Phaeacidiphilus oryzae TaxID=348818 RepID=UPI000B18333C|nr:cytochrome c biogenesis protein ResB [Phaeacidiphilus oryzae]